MTKNRFTRYGLPAITLTALLLAAPMAYAQKGSRLCGYYGDIPPNGVLNGNTLKAGGKIGLLLELTDGAEVNEKVCNKTKKALDELLATNAEFKAFAWLKADYLVNKKGKVTDQKTCEEVGAHFTSTAKTNADMCDYMENKKVFVVVKVYNSMQKTAADTSYTKQN